MTDLEHDFVDVFGPARADLADPQAGRRGDEAGDLGAFVCPVELEDAAASSGVSMPRFLFAPEKVTSPTVI